MMRDKRNVRTDGHGEVLPLVSSVREESGVEQGDEVYISPYAYEHAETDDGRPVLLVMDTDLPNDLVRGLEGAVEDVLDEFHEE